MDIPFLMLVASGCLAAGLRMPVLTVRQLWKENTFSIMSGIEQLWNEQQRLLAVIIFFFSIVFPIAKLLLLAFIWLIPMAQTRRRWLLHGLSALGKWSMLDVFVVAVVIVTVKMGAVTTAKAREGIYLFAVSIALSMLISSMMQRMTRRTLSETPS